jgi:type 1 fimbria pilin
MKANSKKSIKFVALLAMALLIAAVSAATYSTLSITGSVTIGTQQLVWIDGEDPCVDITIVGGRVTMNLAVQPGVMENFTECLFLKSQDTVDHSLNVTVTTALSTEDFDSAKTYIYGNATGSWVYVATLTLTTASSHADNNLLTAGNYYRFTFEIQSKAGATGIKSFELQLLY